MAEHDDSTASAASSRTGKLPEGADVPPAKPRRRALKIALAIVALLGVAVAALIGYGLSESGLSFVVARIVAQTGARITVDEPTGSVAGTMRFGRITWRRRLA